MESEENDEYIGNQLQEDVMDGQLSLLEECEPPTDKTRKRK